MIKFEVFLLKIYIVLFILFNAQYVYTSNTLISSSGALLVSGNLLPPSESSKFDINIGSDYGPVSQSFSNNTNKVQIPISSMNLINPWLRAAPDLGGDIDGGGSSGIGREEEVPMLDLTWKIILFFSIICFVFKTIRKRGNIQQ